MPAQRTTVLFHVATPGLSRRNARAFAKRLESEVAGGQAFICLISSDRELRRLNREFRKQDHATDILSFPSEPETGFLGELAISFEKARQQAVKHGHAVEQEVEILMLHGLLHLLGMDHETDGGRMSRAERKWRASLGLPPGLIERARV
jgi:probable rRNA maturation factor